MTDLCPCCERDSARAALDRVRALHQSSAVTRGVGIDIDGVWSPYCERCHPETYPCATIRALATPVPADAEDGGRCPGVPGYRGGCCDACRGAGGTESGPCSDCLGTGHPHPESADT